MRKFFFILLLIILAILFFYNFSIYSSLIFSKYYYTKSLKQFNLNLDTSYKNIKKSLFYNDMKIDTILLAGYLSLKLSNYTESRKYYEIAYYLSDSEDLLYENVNNHIKEKLGLILFKSDNYDDAFYLFQSILFNKKNEEQGSGFNNSRIFLYYLLAADKLSNFTVVTNNLSILNDVLPDFQRSVYYRLAVKLINDYSIISDNIAGSGFFNLPGNKKIAYFRNKLEILNVAERKYQYKYSDYFIYIDSEYQKLLIFKNKRLEKYYNISTAKKGIGAKKYEQQTPPGFHKVYLKVGDRFQIGSIIKNCVATGKISKIYTKKTNIFLLTTRALYLTGLEKGINKGGKVDSAKRGIAIHGTPAEGLISKKVSMGCIRMNNAEVIKLFNFIPHNTLVYIR